MKHTLGTRRWLLFILLAIVIFASPLRHHLSRLATILSQRIDKAHAQSPVTNLQAMTVKVMVVIYDPILENRNGVKLHAYGQGWNNPDTLTSQLVTDFQTKSHGVVNYVIAERIELDEWPKYWNGERFTDETFADNWDQGPAVFEAYYNTHFKNNNFPYVDGDYLAIINDNGITEKVNSGKVDEVWLWGGPGFGWCESRMVGIGSYWVNCNELSYESPRSYTMMGYNYERGMPEALESYGHRTESILKRAYGSWNIFPETAQILHDWDAFTAQDRWTPGLGGVGTAHDPFNAPLGVDYIRNNRTYASTSENDWYNFPEMTGDRISENCDAWGCPEVGNYHPISSYNYLKWWYDHMPHVPGFKDGRLNNWWRYIVDVDQFKDQMQFLPELEETDLTELNTADWECWAEAATCELEDNTTDKKRGYAAMEFSSTDGGFDTYIRYPRYGGANWNVSNKKYLSFWAKATNPSPNDFQNNSPWIFLRNDDGSYFRYQAVTSVMNQALDQWYRFTIPLTGDATWVRTSSGTPTLTDIDQIKIHNDTWDTGFTIIFDEVGFVDDLAEGNANQWSCSADQATCQLTDETTTVERGQSSLKLDTTAAYDSKVEYPATGSANWDLRNYNYLTFWAYAINTNQPGFQNNSPWIFLKNSDGSYFKYQASTELMDGARGIWKQFQIPLRGDETWARTISGNPSLADIDKLEIHSDTWGSGFVIFFDEVGFVKVGKPPQVSISSPALNTIVNGKIPVTVTASDDTAILRTDLYVDGFFDDSIFDPSDSLYPYVYEWDTTAVNDGIHTLISRTYDSVGNETTSPPVTVFKNPPTQTLTFSPPHDTYVNSGAPNNKYGTATTIRVRKTSTVTLNSYFKFNVSGVSGPVQSAKIRLYVADTSPSGGSIYPVSNTYVGTATPWIETGLTWNNAPTIAGPPLSSVGNAPLNTWVEFDVTPQVSGNGTYSFAIASTNSNAVYYRSDEATGNRPILTVISTNLSLPSPSPSPTPSSSPNPSPTPSLVPTPTPSGSATPSPSGSPTPSPTDVIFSDGFESGNTSAWSAETDAENDLIVTTASALVGTWGLAALIDNTTSMYVRDVQSAAEPRYRARFYFDPNSVSMASSDVHTIFVGRTNTSAAFNVQFNNNTGTSSGYRIRVQIFNDAGGNTNGTYFTLSDAPHTIEVDWQKATSVGANNGTLTLWMDGVSKETISAVDNDTLLVEEARLGPLTGIDAGTAGTVYFDAFESRRSSYIGP